jgi:parallel beta-helix repeat protein
MARSRVVPLAVAGGLLVAGAFALAFLASAQATVSAPRLKAVVVECGDRITTSITVSNDLTDCPDKGLELDGFNIVVNLGGHTIDGAPGSTYGIEIQDVDGVTVTNGKITGFDLAGVNSNPFPYDDGAVSTGIKIQNLRVWDNGNGIFLRRNAGAVVSGNAVFANSQHGIYVFEGSNAARLAGNSATGNGSNGVNVAEAAGVRVQATKAVSNGGSGIGVDASAAATELTANTSNGNVDDGLRVDDPSATLGDNTANFNGDLGIAAVPGVGGTGNRAHDNANPFQCANVVCS